MNPKILIVGTSPYSTSATSRTLDAYLHFWERDKVVQIFSRNWIPQKGHCSELYQITDADLLKKLLHKKIEVGTIYKYADLQEQGSINKNKESSFVGKLYSFGIKHSPTIEIMRRVLWSKKLWSTSKLNNWLDAFQPECVVYSFSNHIFFQQVALYIADRFNIPIVVIMGDDFFFNNHFSISPSYWLYRMLFRTYTKKILLRKGSGASFCSKKLMERYNESFHLGGDVVYTNSSVQRRTFRPINRDNPLIVYFGSIRLGRNNSLIDIADVLQSINPNYKLEVYSGETDEHFYKKLKNHPGIIFGGSISYSEVQNKIAACDIYVIVEGFRKKDVLFTRYSLSTKTADSLASGVTTLMYGPQDAGVVEYMKETESALVCTEKKDLKQELIRLIEDQNIQQTLYNNAVICFKKNHLVESTANRFLSIINNTINSKDKI